MMRRFCWSWCMVGLRRRCAREFDSVRRMRDDGRVQRGLGVLLSALTSKNACKFVLQGHGRDRGHKSRAQGWQNIFTLFSPLQSSPPCSSTRGALVALWLRFGCNIGRRRLLRVVPRATCFGCRCSWPPTPHSPPPTVWQKPRRCLRRKSRSSPLLTPPRGTPRPSRLVIPPVQRPR